MQDEGIPVAKSFHPSAFTFHPAASSFNPHPLSFLPMRIAFIDPSGWDINVEAPFRRPLGGSQSAACYLAIALAELGHDVFFVSATSQPGNVRGVTCLSTSSFTPADMPELKLDAAVLLLA